MIDGLRKNICLNFFSSNEYSIVMEQHAIFEYIYVSQFAWGYFCENIANYILFKQKIFALYRKSRILSIKRKNTTKKIQYMRSRLNKGEGSKRASKNCFYLSRLQSFSFEVNKHVAKF